MTDSWEDNLWTDATRASYLEAGEAAIDALRSHLAVVAAASSDADEKQIDDSAETTRLAFVALSDAQFGYSSTVAPFSLLEDEDEDEDDTDEAEHTSEDSAHDKISLLVRRDFQLTSEAELIAAGRAAYSQVSDEDAVALDVEDVDDLGRALFQIVQAGGIDALSDVAGLEPVSGIVLAVGRDELMTEEDLDELIDDPTELFAGEGEVLYSQAEVWSE
jgi:hypothetical protein